MDLKQIEYFVKVAELGSFTRAASLLGVAQPALSRQVGLLEAELKLPLLVRNGRGAAPTEAGRLLLEHGQGILHQVSRAREELDRLGGALVGRVAIGLPTSIAKVITVPITKAFRLALPQSSLAVTEGLSSFLEEALVTGRIDIALLYNVRSRKEIKATPLIEEQLYLVRSIKHSQQQHSNRRSKGDAKGLVEIADLAGFDIITPTKPNAIRMMIELALIELDLTPRIVLEIDGVAAILDLVEQGVGLAVLPRNAVTTSPNPLLFKAIPIKGFKTQVSLALSSQRPSTLTQKAMIGLINDATKTYLTL